MMIDALSPRSIVQVSGDTVPEVDCAVRAVACEIGEVFYIEEATVGATRQAGLFLGGIEQHSWDCANKFAPPPISQVESVMWEWADAFPRLRLDQVQARAVEMLLIDLHNRSYSVVSDMLAYWRPFLSERAAILAHGTGSEGQRALLAFARGTPLEAWAVYSAGEGKGAATLLQRDPQTKRGSHGDEQPCTCWGCAAHPERIAEARPARVSEGLARDSLLWGGNPSDGDKWDVAGVYINIDASRELRMEEQIKKLSPKASLSRFQGKDGAAEEVCQRVGKNTATEVAANSVCCTLSHWLAIHAFFQEDGAEYLLVLEDDVSFDLVPFWPGTLSQFLDLASEVHPGWHVLNLAPSNWRNVSQWLRHDPFVEYDFAGGGQRFFGAVMYAVRRSVEVERLAAEVVEP